jgi:anthranilate synthase component 1
MASPTLVEFTELFESLGGSPGVVPVFREVLADLDTPVSAFIRVCEGEGAPQDHTFLLESVEGGERWARYSFIGLDPAFVLRAQGRKCERLEKGKIVHTEERDDPLSFLEENLSRLTWKSLDDLPRFAGGAVGWLGWDAVRWWENLPSRHAQVGAQPLVWAVPRSLLIFDNLRHCIQVVHLVFTEEHTEPERAYEEASTAIEALIRRLRAPLKTSDSNKVSTTRTESGFDQAAFEKAVEQVQEWILAGDSIQVVLSQRFDLHFEGRAIDLYRALRAVNPSPYMFYLRFPEQQVIGASPEVMVRVQEGEAVVAPIAGTRHRGANEAEDLALADELLADPKEVAEHVMLVDLARNDLGRISKKGSVRVANLMEIQRFSHVMHIVSDVRGQLADGLTAFDAVRATFPAGTLSGAPKIRAMEIIDQLEPVGRGLYGGAVGWFSFSGEADLAIAIRTAWKTDGPWQLQVGAGIVADSQPDLEYQETLNKAAGLLAALERAGRGL